MSQKELQKNVHYANFPAVKISKLLYLLLIIPMLSQAQSPQRNYDWIESNIIKLLDSLQVRESIGGKSFTINLGAVKGEQKGFIKNLLLKYFENNLSNRVGDSTPIIHIEQFKTGIVYEQKSYGFLNLGTNYLRQNNIVFNGWIENENSRPVKSFNINKIFKEEIEGYDFSTLEESPYHFTKGQTKDLSFWTCTLEPVIVGATIGVVVYLFFSVRS
jgi:hypothetical protein